MPTVRKLQSKIKHSANELQINYALLRIINEILESIIYYISNVYYNFAETRFNQKTFLCVDTKNRKKTTYTIINYTI